MEWEASLCSGCRRKRTETFATEMDDAYEVTPMRCFACAARERASAKFAKSEYADTAGLYFAIHDPEPGD